MSFSLSAFSGHGSPKSFGSILGSSLLPVVPIVPDTDSALRVARAMASNPCEKRIFFRLKILFLPVEVC